ncbi:IclR family transcriptional regulator [Sphingomonas paucimobilis]|uniref:IclR family transcriptional regulator n=1 Tax=Sphingomonas paucimobilis TaxID=13689 RepID=UPI0028D854A8|nr:IclR family transcriptional regulator [Sphingomonas paucimobilis]
MDEDERTSPAAERRRGIQSVEAGMRVLDAMVTLGQAAPLSAIAQASAMSPSQAHRYLASLTAAGMARQDAASGRYDLGPAALRLGLGALARIDAFRTADTAIGTFTQDSGRTVQIAALGPLGPTIVRWHVGRPPVMTSFHVGSVLPLLGSATGHAFLAFVPPGEVDGLLQAELAASSRTPEEVAELRATVRAAGFAHVAGAMVPGLRATAVPIFDLQGRAILTATALSQADADLDRDAATDQGLVEVCRTISGQLGWFD